MKIALVGSSGYISSFILERFKAMDSISEVKKIDKVGDIDFLLDLETPNNFDYSVLEDIDFVVFPAAISGPDMCANEFEKCWKINVKGTSYFIEKALDIGCKVLFFSSDAVFGKDLGYEFDENSPTNAHTPYGKMKKAIEDKFKKNKSFKAIRLSYVTSSRDRFVNYCLSCIREDKVAEIFHPFYRNCITVHDVLDAICWLVSNWDSFDSFVLNVTGTELVSRLRIADELNRVCNGKLKYIVKIPEPYFFENRPQITQMKSLYLYKLKILTKKTFTEKIQDELRGIEL